MSRDASGDIDCDKAVEHLYLYLDQELSGEVRAAVRVHLETCEDCSGHFEFEAVFLKFVETRCRGQCAPDELRRRIFDKLRQEPSAQAD